MKSRFASLTIGVLCTFVLMTSDVAGQRPTPTSTPAEEPVRINTEEVHLTMRVDGPYAGAVPKLRLEDFTVSEDGVPQSATSIKSLPPQVLILVDTGAALSFAKSRAIATLATQVALNNLPDHTVCSVMTYNDRIQTIVPWTENKHDAISSVSGGLSTGRRSLLRSALAQAATSFTSRPIENRHLILVTDGLDESKALAPETGELADLDRANVTIHVLSYTAIEVDGAKDAGQRVRVNLRPSKAKPRVPKQIYDEMVDSLDVKLEHREFLKTMNEATQIIVIDLDAERRKMLKARRQEWETAEGQLQTLATRSGGSIHVPKDAGELLTQAVEIGRAIGSHYDVTYMPERSVAESPKSEERSITVASRSDAIKLTVRKTLRRRK